MKNLTKIFMAVAVAMFAFSCVNDTTEDIAVKVGGKTTLAISLGGGNRTTLGEKADGVYPITWAEGDQITVNGKTSDELTSTDGAGSASATFTFNTESLAAPYCVAYPAAEAGQVVFAAEQEYVSGSFDNGAATMYGYATSGNITLNHLTSVLKIGIAGEETLSCVRISTVDRKPIAGAFDIDFATGAITATENSAEVITYSFGSGLILSSEPTYIHVAVPAGVYNELYITLEDENGGVMYTTIKANDEKPLVAGRVREFKSTISYAAIAEDADTFIINDYGTLLSFKSAIEEAENMGDTAILTKNAVMTADVVIPMSVWDPWSSINAPSYTGTFNGNGYAIIYDTVFTEDKLSTAPLFSTTAATIKGVHIKGVYIGDSYTSEFIGSLVDVYLGSKITNCSANGNIDIVRSTNQANYIGGLVGKRDVAADWEISDCVNNCNINLNVPLGDEGKATYIAGIVGYGGGETTTGGATMTFKNNINNGDITITGSTSATVNAGGIVSMYGIFRTVFENCHNTGDITIELAKGYNARFGGVAGRTRRDAEKGEENVTINALNCSNSGNLKFAITEEYTGGSASHTMIGGCFGQLEDTGVYDKRMHTITNCDNSGKIEVCLCPTSETSTFNNIYYVGGIIGLQYGRNTITNCDNTGECVTLKLPKTSNYMNVGGLIGRICSYASNSSNGSKKLNPITIKNCTNKADVTLSLSKPTSGEINIGGIIGHIFSHNTRISTFSLEGLTNEGSVTADINGISEGTPRTNIGGIFGTSFYSEWNDYAKQCTFTVKNCHNIGSQGKKIYITGSMHYYVYTGGITGYHLFPTTFTDCSNSMDMKYDAKAQTECWYHGGLIGKLCHKETNLQSTVTNFKNTGNSYATISSNNIVGISGIFGYARVSSGKYTKLTVTGAKNRGNIYVEGTENLALGELWIGGIAARLCPEASSVLTFTETVNVCNATVKDVYLNSYDKARIGGALGNINLKSSSIESYATIKAYAFKDGELIQYPKIGALAGNVENSTALSSGKVGGIIIDGAVYSADGNHNETNYTTVLDASNYIKYLTNNRDLTEYAGVTLLTEAPTIE